MWYALCLFRTTRGELFCNGGKDELESGCSISLLKELHLQRDGLEIGDEEEEFIRGKPPTGSGELCGKVLATSSRQEEERDAGIQLGELKTNKQTRKGHSCAK